MRLQLTTEMSAANYHRNRILRLRKMYTGIVTGRSCISPGGLHERRWTVESTLVEWSMWKLLQKHKTHSQVKMSPLKCCRRNEPFKSPLSWEALNWVTPIHATASTVTSWPCMCGISFIIASFLQSALTLWRPLMPYGHSYGASCARLGYAVVICNFWHPGTLTLSPGRQSWGSGLSVRVPGCQKLQMTTA